MTASDPGEFIQFLPPKPDFLLLLTDNFIEQWSLSVPKYFFVQANRENGTGPVFRGRRHCKNSHCDIRIDILVFVCLSFIARNFLVAIAKFFTFDHDTLRPVTQALQEPINKPPTWPKSCANACFFQIFPSFLRTFYGGNVPEDKIFGVIAIHRGNITDHEGEQKKHLSSYCQLNYRLNSIINISMYHRRAHHRVVVFI